MTIQSSGDGISEEHFKDQELRPTILYLQDGTLSEDVKLGKKVVVDSVVYAICNDVLYCVGSKQMETAHDVVPQQLCQRVMQN